MSRITLLARIDSHTGYGQHAIQLVRHLERLAGAHVSIRPISVDEQYGSIPADIKERFVSGVQPEEWEILLSPPNFAPTPGKRTVYFTMSESTGLSPVQIHNLNSAAVIVVPSEWNKRTFENLGIKPPIHVVPLGVDPMIFRPTPMNMEGPTVFGVAGRTKHGELRKGVDYAVMTFLEAFRNDKNVRLEVKVHPDDPLLLVDDPRVRVYKEHWTEQQIAAWLQSLTAFVSASTGEGWGLWQNQAMACARPVICAIHAGLRAFIGDRNSMGCGLYIENAGERWLGKWAIPDLETMIYHMRSVYKNREFAARMGEVAESTVRNLTWENSVYRLAHYLRECGALAEGKFEYSGREDYEPKEVMSTVTPPYETIMEQCLAKSIRMDQIYFYGGGMYYNPTIIRYQGKLLCFVRRATFDPKSGGRLNSRIQAWYLAEDMAPTFLKTIALGEHDSEEDPRISLGPEGELWLSYSEYTPGKPVEQAFCRLTPDLTPAETWRPRIGKNGVETEKNWVWFWHGGQWHMIYNIEPHHVFALNGNGEPEIEISVKWDASLFWPYGRPRGSSIPIRVGDEYFCIFHSALPWKKHRRHYYVGAYAFEAFAPFRPTRISTKPILIGEPNDERKMVEPHAVIFPCGAILEDGVWTVVAGVNDEKCIWFKMPHQQLLADMVQL